jgi:hypothetical protein
MSASCRDLVKLSVPAASALALSALAGTGSSKPMCLLILGGAGFISAEARRTSPAAVRGGVGAGANRLDEPKNNRIDRSVRHWSAPLEGVRRDVTICSWKTGNSGRTGHPVANSHGRPPLQ